MCKNSIVRSLSDYVKAIKAIKKDEKEVLFFRGHADQRYLFKPGLYRDVDLLKKEDVFYHDIMVDYPQEFDRHDHMSNLVKVQHYGGCTRILDISTNMLSALFFAAEEGGTVHGEVMVFSVDRSKVLHHTSDRTLMLACLAPLKYEDKVEIKKFCESNRGKITDRAVRGNEAMQHFLHEIRGEFPAFETCIIGEDLLKSYFVMANRDNARMQSQCGAFVICGLDEERLNELGNKADRITIDKDSKQEILKELELCNITSSTVYPDLERRVRYLERRQKLSPQKI